jgi:hypothetical protein
MPIVGNRGSHGGTRTIEAGREYASRAKPRVNPGASVWEGSPPAYSGRWLAKGCGRQRAQAGMPRVQVEELDVPSTPGRTDKDPFTRGEAELGAGSRAMLPGRSS